MRSLLLPFLLLAVFATCIAAQSTIPEKDFHIWNETTFVLPVLRSKDSEGKMHDRLSLFQIGNLRLGQNGLVPVDDGRHNRAGRPSDVFAIGVNLKIRLR
jgi:hypothetical protein